MASSIAKNIREIQLELVDTLSSIFDGYSRKHNNYFYVANSDTLVNGDILEYSGPDGNRIPNFVRDEFNWKHPVWLQFGGRTIALAQARPHGVIKILEVKNCDRYIRGLLVRTIHENFPKVKVIYG